MSAATHIQEVMEEKGTVTLKAIAYVLGVPAPRLYSVAKQPKEGEIYDAKVYNWEAIERFVTRRLDADQGYATIEDVIDLALKADEEFKLKDGRRGVNRGSVNKQIEVDGKLIPARKFATFEMSDDGDNLICLKKDPRVFKMVLQTESHTVLIPVKDAEGTPASQEVKVISNGMLNHKGVGPANIEETIKANFEAMAEAETVTAEESAE